MLTTIGQICERHRPGAGLRAAAAVLALCAVWVGPSPSAAQTFFDRLLQPFLPSPPQYDRVDPYRSERPPPARPRPAPRPRPVVERPVEKPAVRPAATPTRFVAVLGDGFALTLGQELGEILSDQPDVGILRRARENGGLVRDDFADWLKEVQDLLDGRAKIDFAVVMLGSNDRQGIRNDGGTEELLSSRWKELYGGRVKALASLFAQHGVPLVWVGLPIMKNERLAADMSGFNDIYREQATAAGAFFVDTWEAYGDAKGQYSPFGPNIDGQTVRLRAADGMHFTKAGARKLAQFIEGDVRRLLERRSAKTPETAARPLPTSPPAQDPVAPAPDGGATPVAGPVMSLTTPVSTPGGMLMSGATGAAPSDAAAALIDRTLVEGIPVGPKPGRADDRRWPQP